jgi:hypothetical protein
MFFISQEVRGQGQATPGQHRHQTVVAQCAHQTIEGHRRDMIEDRAELQTQSSMRRQEGVTSDLRAHLAIAQDKMRQDREHRFARRALYPPDRHPIQTDPDVMGVARQAPPRLTGGLVFELKADG